MDGATFGCKSCATAQSIEVEVQSGELSKAISAQTSLEQGAASARRARMATSRVPCSGNVGADVALLSSTV